MLYGADGCRGGWVVAEASENLDEPVFSVTARLQIFLDRAGPEAQIAIDIPIGLPEHQPRTCDIAARRILGRPRASSVFPAPARRAIHQTSFEEALARNHEALGTGMTFQTYSIMPKIAEVDALMTLERQRHVREVHPEVTFARLNGAPMKHNKRLPQGRAERITVLRAAGVRVSEGRLIQERNRLGPGMVSFDDLIDALACLVTSRCIKSGRSQSLGHPGEMDARGLRMEIVTPAVQARSI